MTENGQALQAVMDAAGCDRWIAGKALASSNYCVQAAVNLVKDRMSYGTTVCRCGEFIAGGWSFCPYCGTKKITSPELPEVIQSKADEKRAILQRLKDYRAAHGPGSLAVVSSKTAHHKNRRISEDILRDLCVGMAPKLRIENWQSIRTALDKLEQMEAEDG